jgi:branched-chain amino acid transport system substrate-binding protein
MKTQRLGRRRFLKLGVAGAGAVVAGSRYGRAAAQAKETTKIGFVAGLTGAFSGFATDSQRGATLAVEQINARGGLLGKKVELLVRDDQLNPRVGAQRARELIENDKVDFMAGGLAAHVQMAINEQTKKARMIFFSCSMSNEITAKPDGSRYTFHEALNPTINSRAIAEWVFKNLGKRWWVLYADYAWGKQTLAGFTRVAEQKGATILGSTPYPLGSSDFSGYLPRIQGARPEVLLLAAPGVDIENSLKQMTSFGMKKEMKIAHPLLLLSGRKAGGAEPFAGIYGGVAFYWELKDRIPSAKQFVDSYWKRWSLPPDTYGGYGYSAILEIARGVELAKSTDSEAVANALRANPVYDHYKGKQWWRPCDNKSFQDQYIVKPKDPGKEEGEWGLFELIDTIPASEAADLTCAEKGWA